MSRDEREDEENWKKRQDERADERARQFDEDFRRQQEKARAKTGGTIGDVAKAVPHLFTAKDDPGPHPLPGHGGGHSAGDAGVHTMTGAQDYQEAAVFADHHGPADPLLIPTIAAVAAIQSVQEAINVAGLINRINKTLDGPLEELRAGVSAELDRFSETVRQAFGDLEKWVTERAFPEKGPEITPPAAPPPAAPALEGSPREPEPAPAGKGETERDARDPAEAALLDKQAKERAELEEKLTAARDKLAARTEDKPPDVRESLMDNFDAAAKDARDDKAAQHAEELRRLREDKDRDRDDR